MFKLRHNKRSATIGVSSSVPNLVEVPQEISVYPNVASDIINVTISVARYLYQIPSIENPEEHCSSICHSFIQAFPDHEKAMLQLRSFSDCLRALSEIDSLTPELLDALKSFDPKDLFEIYDLFSQLKKMNLFNKDTLTVFIPLFSNVATNPDRLIYIQRWKQLLSWTETISLEAEVIRGMFQTLDMTRLIYKVMAYINQHNLGVDVAEVIHNLIQVPELAHNRYYLFKHCISNFGKLNIPIPSELLNYLVQLSLSEEKIKLIQAAPSLLTNPFMLQYMDREGFLELSNAELIEKSIMLYNAMRFIQIDIEDSYFPLFINPDWISLAESAFELLETRDLWHANFRSEIQNLIYQDSQILLAQLKILYRLNSHPAVMQDQSIHDQIISIYDIDLLSKLDLFLKYLEKNFYSLTQEEFNSIFRNIESIRTVHRELVRFMMEPDVILLAKEKKHILIRTWLRTYPNNVALFEYPQCAMLFKKAGSFFNRIASFLEKNSEHVELICTELNKLDESTFQDLSIISGVWLLIKYNPQDTQRIVQITLDLYAVSMLTFENLEAIYKREEDQVFVQRGESQRALRRNTAPEEQPSEPTNRFIWYKTKSNSLDSSADNNSKFFWFNLGRGQAKEKIAGAQFTI